MANLYHFLIADKSSPILVCVYMLGLRWTLVSNHHIWMNMLQAGVVLQLKIYKKMLLWAWKSPWFYRFPRFLTCVLHFKCVHMYVVSYYEVQTSKLVHKLWLSGCPLQYLSVLCCYCIHILCTYVEHFPSYVCSCYILQEGFCMYICSEIIKIKNHNA